MKYISNEKIKKILKSNKIYFETIAAASLSLMSIFLAYTQYQQSNLQTKITEVQALPQFIIKSTTREREDFDRIGKVIEESEIFIENKGAIVYDLKAEYVVRFFLNAGKSKDSFFVKDYFNAAYSTQEGNNLILSITGWAHYNSYKKVLYKVWEIWQKAPKDNEMPKIDVHCIVNLKYKDVLGRQHTKFYDVLQLYGGSEITIEEGCKIFKEYSENEKEHTIVDFESITADYISQRLKL